jgi:hypothetical protein
MNYFEQFGNLVTFMAKEKNNCNALRMPAARHAGKGFLTLSAEFRLTLDCTA